MTDRGGGGGGGGGGAGAAGAVFTDDTLVPLPVISLAVSLIALLAHWGLAVFVADLRSLYGRYVMTLLTLHVVANFLQLTAGGLERLGPPSHRTTVSLVVCNAGSHFCQLLTASFSLASTITLWREERRQARRQALIRVLSCRRYARCLTLCVLVSCVIVGLGLFSSLHQTKWSPRLFLGSGNASANNASSLVSMATVDNGEDWRRTAEPLARQMDPGYTRVSLLFIYRHGNCSTPGSSVVAAYVGLLAGPAMLLYALHIGPLLQLGRIVDSMVEERRLSNRTRASVNSFLLLGKFAASSAVVWLCALLALLLRPSCDGMCLWYAYYMLHALQSIFLCISCLFARAPIEILMRRFARKRDEAKLESGLGLLAAVMHSKRKNKSIRPGRAPKNQCGQRHRQHQADPSPLTAGDS